MYRTYIALAFLLAVAIIGAAGLVFNYYQRGRKRRPVTDADHFVVAGAPNLARMQQLSRTLRQRGLTATGRTPSQPVHQHMPPRHGGAAVDGARRGGFAVAPTLPTLPVARQAPPPADSSDALALGLAGFQLAESLFDSSPGALSFDSSPGFDSSPSFDGGGGDFGGGGSTGDF